MNNVKHLDTKKIKFPPDSTVWCEDEWENLLVLDADKDRRLLVNGKWYHVSELEEGSCRLSDEQRQALNINLPEEDDQ